MTVTDPGHPGPPEWGGLMTVVEVAAALRVSRTTVYRLVHAGTLPGKRLGRSVRVPRHAVEDFLRDAGMGSPP